MNLSSDPPSSSLDCDRERHAGPKLPSECSSRVNVPLIQCIPHSAGAARWAVPGRTTGWGAHGPSTHQSAVGFVGERHEPHSPWEPGCGGHADRGEAAIPESPGSGSVISLGSCEGAGRGREGRESGWRRVSILTLLVPLARRQLTWNVQALG